MSKKPVGAATVILDAGGRVLLVKHSYGKLNWELPGGLSEQYESAEETAMREVKEETGLDVTVGRMTGVYYEPANDMHHFVFRCHHAGSGQPEPSSPEILECMYCSIDQLPTPMSDFTYNRIQDALHPDGENLFHIIGPRQWREF